MGLAETAVLAVELKLGTTGSFAGATSQLKGVEAAAVSATSRGIGAVERGFGVASVAANKFGGAMGHAKSQIGGLISGPLGLLGLGAGLFTVGGALEHGITKAQDFGAEVSKLKAITGLSAETISALAAGLEHFGIGSDAALRSIGMLEKNVGLLAARKGAIADFEKTFSFALTDSNGKIKDANELILTTADYFNNKSIPATEKAAAIAKLFGRQWQVLLPALIAGRKGIEDAEQAAKDLGLTLTEANIGSLAKFREATRELGTAVGGLELQVGLALVPALTDFTNVAERFVAQNRDKIVGFFKDAAHFAQDLGSVVEHQVIPAFGVIAGAWGAVPKELRDLVVAGFVGNKVIKWTFGFSPISFVTTGLKDALGLGLKKALIDTGLGKLFVQPVFVTNPGFGLPGVGGALGAAEGEAVVGAEAVAGATAGEAGFFSSFLAAGALPVLLTAGTLAALGVAFVSAMQQASDVVPPDQGGTPGQAFSRGHGFGPVSGHDQRTDLGPLANAVSLEDRDLRDIKNFTQGTENNVGKMADDVAALPGSLRDLRSTFSADLKTLIHATKAADVQKAAKKIGDTVGKGVGDAGNTSKVLAALKTQLSHALKVHDSETAAILRTQIAHVEKVLPDRKYAAQQYAAVAGILKDGKITSAESKQLKSIMAAVKDHGLPAVTRGIQQKIDQAKNAQKLADAGIKAAVAAVKAAVHADTQAIKDKDLSVTLGVTTNVSVRDLQNVTIRANSFRSKSVAI